MATSLPSAELEIGFTDWTRTATRSSCGRGVPTATPTWPRSEARRLSISRRSSSRSGTGPMRRPGRSHRALFADPAILAHYREARTAAEPASAVLRIRLFIGPTAPSYALQVGAAPRPRHGQTSGDPRENPLLPVPEQPRRLTGPAPAPGSSSGPWSRSPTPPTWANTGWLRLTSRVSGSGPGGPGEIPIVEVTGPETFTHLIDRLHEEFDILYLVGPRGPVH